MRHRQIHAKRHPTTAALGHVPLAPDRYIKYPMPANDRTGLYRSEDFDVTQQPGRGKALMRRRMGRRLAPAQAAQMRLVPGSRIKNCQGRAWTARACFCGRWRCVTIAVASGRRRRGRATSIDGCSETCAVARPTVGVDVPAKTCRTIVGMDWGKNKRVSSR